MPIQTRRLRADNILVLGWATWLVCFATLPISPIFYGDLISVSLFIASNLALWIGLKTFEISNSVFEDAAVTERAYQLLRYLIPLGALSFVIRAFDYFVLRGVPLFGSFADVRRALEASSPNLASAVFGLLSPSMLAAGILGTFCAAKGKRTLRVVLAIGLFFAYPLFSFLNGGRSTLALVGSLGIIAFFLGSPRLTRRQVLFIIATLLLFFALTMALFIPRLLESGLDLTERIGVSGYNQLVPLDDWVMIWARNANIWVSAVVLYVLSLGQYFLHAVFEFFALIREKNPSDPLLLGRYQFIIVDQFAKVIEHFIGGGHVDLEIYNPRSGLYTTFWGPAFIDFKYLMPIYSWMFGVVVSYFQKRVSDGDVYALPLYCLFLFQIGSSIMANGLLWAAAIYSNVMFFVVWLLLTFGKQRRKRGHIAVCEAKG